MTAFVIFVSISSLLLSFACATIANASSKSQGGSDYGDYLGLMFEIVFGFLSVVLGVVGGLGILSLLFGS